MNKRVLYANRVLRFETIGVPLGQFGVPPARFGVPPARFGVPLVGAILILKF